MPDAFSVPVEERVRYLRTMGANLEISMTEREKMPAGELYDPELFGRGGDSVVTRDVPDGVFAARNPRRVLRDIAN